jgi:hypothetical protein
MDPRPFLRGNRGLDILDFKGELAGTKLDIQSEYGTIYGLGVKK